MKYILTVFTLFGFSAMATEVSLSPENLESLLKDKNTRVSASKLNLEAADARTGALTRSFFPSLDLYAGQESFKIGDQEQKSQPAYGAELKINLFNGGVDGLENKIRNLEVSKLGYQSQKTLAEELLKARQIYWQMSYYSKKKDLLLETIALNSKNLHGAVKRIRSGVATDSDRFEFEMKDVDLRRDLRENDLAQKNLEQEMGLLLNLPSDATFKLAEELNHQHDFIKELSSTDPQNSFWHMDEKTAAEQKDLSASQSGRQWWPKIEAFAGYNQYNEREKEYADASDRQETVVGLRMRLSLADGLSAQQDASAFRKQALAEKRNAEYQRAAVQISLETELRKLNFLHDQVHEAEENISRAERYYKLTQSEYVRGVKNSPDVLGAAEKLFERRHKYFEILRDFQVSRAQALAALGK